MDSLLGKVQYYWVTSQCEYATDVMFRSVSVCDRIMYRLSFSTRRGKRRGVFYTGKFFGEEIEDEDEIAFFLLFVIIFISTLAYKEPPHKLKTTKSNQKKF